MPTYARAWREKTGLTQEQLASQIGRERTAISKLENGQHGYGQAIVELVAGALGVHPCQLLFADPDDETSIWSIAGAAQPLSEAQRRIILRNIQTLLAESEPTPPSV